MFKAIDLFAGIGGIRLGFEQTGKFQNVFSAEIDKFACQTYACNFGDDPFCDVTKLDPNNIPDFDVLTAGFPCQAFSVAGNRKGFADVRGTLFFDIVRILQAKKPRAFLLENVKGLLSHDKGKTFKIIEENLKALGYHIHYKVLNSKNYGVPQHRERLYVAGFSGKDIDFRFPKGIKLEKSLKDILEKNVDDKYYLSDRYIDALEKHKAKHKNKGNGFGYEIVHNIANTLLTGGMGREKNLIKDERGLRKLTPRECARLQGFDDNYIIPVSDTQAYKQFGNSVSVPVIKAIAEEIIDFWGRNGRRFKKMGQNKRSIL